MKFYVNSLTSPVRGALSLVRFDTLDSARIDAQKIIGTIYLYEVEQKDDPRLKKIRVTYEGGPPAIVTLVETYIDGTLQ